MGISYKKRMKIAVEPELIYVPELKSKGMLFRELNLYAKSGVRLAKGYRRVVIGGRGPYVEFHLQDIDWTNFYVPDEELYRIESKKVFYEEWRSIGEDYVKLYRQKRTVAYADYRVHMCYISPFDLYMEDNVPVIV